MWHGDAQCRDCRVGLMTATKAVRMRATLMAMPLRSLLEFKNEIIGAYTAVFVSLMTYPGVRCSSLVSYFQGFATDEAVDRLSLRHNVKKGCLRS
jgi:hypothetical protein